MDLIIKHQNEVNQACLSSQVSELYAFGSVLTDKFNEESDIDFIVSIETNDPIQYGENYFQLKFQLEKIFNRKIDLLEQKALRNEVFNELINKKKTLVYARRNKGVA